MNLIKVKLKNSTVNHKHETSVVYDDGYINLDKVSYVIIMGSTVRFIFSGVQGDYVELDIAEWERVCCESRSRISG